MKKIAIIFLILVMIVTFAACGTTTTSTDETTETKIIIDGLGREVEVPSKIDSIGSLGVMRYLTYMEASDLVKGGTDMDNVSELTRPYTYVYPEYKDLAVIGQGGAGGIVPFDEEIIKLEPDVIFVVSDYGEPDELSKKTEIPVVVISTDVAINSPGLFNETMKSSFEIIGEVLGKEDRATEINNFMEVVQKDLNDRTKNIPNEGKPKVYNGALNFKGKHGFDGTSANYGPFLEINANNVTDQTGQSGAFTVDLEQVLEWNPDIIFLDPENMDLVNEQYKKNPDFFNSLDAVKNDKVYTQLAYNNNYANVEIALADAYYAGSVIYPEEFKNVDPEEKADEIFKFLLGKEIYSDFVAVGQGFGQLTIGK